VRRSSFGGMSMAAILRTFFIALLLALGGAQ
jgi:hypothetical protein